MMNKLGVMIINETYTNLQFERSEYLKETLKNQVDHQVMCGDILVNVCFSEKGETLSDHLINYFKMLKNK